MNPEAVIFIGAQASGKSTFYRTRMINTHLRLSMDMLNSRWREEILLRACIESKAAFVIDNTNPTKAERERYILPAKAAKLPVVGYYFRSRLSDLLERNARRAETERVPEVGLRGTYSRLELPGYDEGFDRLFYVQIVENEFEVQEWANEVR
jgi:predicted kinase